MLEILDLGGQWQVSCEKQKQVYPATVPGCIHTDLIAAGVIDDPFWRDNEESIKWIGEKTWVYSRPFKVGEKLLGMERVLIRCEGLDTVATVMLNGRVIAQTEDQYRTWEFDVKEYLKVGDNELSVRFDSPKPLQLERMMAKKAFQGIDSGKHSWRGRSTVRKSPSNYGWDWGPAMPTCGIWRPIKLVGFDTARLVDVEVLQHHMRGKVGLEVLVDAERAGRAKLEAKVVVSLKGKLIAEGETVLRAGKGKVCLDVKQPKLWWPSGMGDQPLYDIEVVLCDAGGAELDSECKRVGLRTLRLDRHKDQWGESFQFVANGVPFFAKGGNWIPADQFPTRLTEAKYRDLLISCAEANMNMIRVWGGGIYEPDCFYDICDELGLCIWQDFMFGCSAYPTFDKEFMANSEAEAIDNVKRIRHHACLALWCGNNEIEQCCVSDKWVDHYMSWKDYSKLFDDVLGKVVKKYDRQRDYWPSSPHTSVGDRSDVNDPTCGDAHLWAVWHRREPFEWYRTCAHRFNSEFGFQAFPELKTVKGYTLPEDRNITSPIMEHHQRSRSGNSLMMHYMLDWFRLPNGFENTLWMSQIQQGMAIKYAVEHWRRSMPRGMGTLYWQINDCWPVASWSSIDYHGRWKALNYMARHFFAPVLVSALEDVEKGSVEVHVTSDQLKAGGGKVVWELTDVMGQVIDGGSKAVRIPACENAKVAMLRLGKQLKSYDKRDLMLWLTLKDKQGKVISRNFSSFVRPKSMALVDPKIKVSVAKGKGGQFKVTLKAGSPALWTWLELRDVDAKLSDNFFHLRKGKVMVVEVNPAKAMTLAEIRKRLVVRSLYDTYQ